MDKAYVEERAEGHKLHHDAHSRGPRARRHEQHHVGMSQRGHHPNLLFITHGSVFVGILGCINHRSGVLYLLLEVPLHFLGGLIGGHDLDGHLSALATAREWLVCLGA